jgi:hypothetical protein
MVRNSNPKRSVCGLISVALPLLGLGVEQILIRLHGADNDPGAIILVVPVMFLVGIGAGIVGMVREERLRWLPAVGFGFNIVLIVVHMAIG